MIKIINYKTLREYPQIYILKLQTKPFKIILYKSTVIEFKKTMENTEVSFIMKIRHINGLIQTMYVECDKLINNDTDNVTIYSYELEHGCTPYAMTCLCATTKAVIEKIRQFIILKTLEKKETDKPFYFKLYREIIQLLHKNDTYLNITF